MHQIISAQCLPTNQQDELGAAGERDYLQILVRAETLKRLFGQRVLHADELYCGNQQSKQALKHLLLSLLIDDAN